MCVVMFSQTDVIQGIRWCDWQWHLKLDPVRRFVVLHDFCGWNFSINLHGTSLEVYGDVIFDIHMTVHHVKFLIIKPTRCTNFSNLFLEWNSTCFRQFLRPSSGVFHCTQRQWYMSYRSCHTAGSGHSVLILLTSFQQTCMTYTVAVCTVKNSDDGQRNCPKHVEFHSKNKFEKLVHLVGFVIRKVMLFLFKKVNI